jgi:uncharacterized protein YjbI with pentapeptide repeats
MVRFVQILSSSLIMFGFAPVSLGHAESGSCYSKARLEDPFIGEMVSDLIGRGQAFRFRDGGVYAVFENLPGAAICDLNNVDLSGFDLSGILIEKELLDGARLCRTALPDGSVSDRDCK